LNTLYFPLCLHLSTVTRLLRHDDDDAAATATAATATAAADAAADAAAAVAAAAVAVAAVAWGDECQLKDGRTRMVVRGGTEKWKIGSPKKGDEMQMSILSSRLSRICDR
jgi:hypothetical protein